ncbi:MAG: alpha/beta fold hydrolase [Myxococcales bacterium]|nr:alpha/beta fold hydrolase [Myxococcales bacterium]MCB9523064.1 alpha/beta fold hydrolase [Myxococcales bacterium]
MLGLDTAKQLAGAVGDAVGRLVPMELRGVDTHGGDLPFEVVHERGPTKVLYYAPRGEVRHRTPIVFSYSLINRYYILDFMPGKSLLEHLTGQGFACYVIDWGAAGVAESQKTWGDYALGYLGDAVRVACQREGVDQVSLYGYCMGGTMALSYAALRPEKVKNFVAMAMPVDFHDEGILSRWTQRQFFSPDAVIDAYGNVPTWLMESGFRLMAPLTNMTKWRGLWEAKDRDGFVDTWRRLEKWSSDNVPFPGGVYRQYIRDCYQENRFCQSQMVVNGERVDLEAFDKPLLVVLAQKDHIVPRPSAEALMGIVASEDKTLMDFPTGHIGLSTSSKSPKKYWPQIAAWLAARD